MRWQKVLKLWSSGTWCHVDLYKNIKVLMKAALYSFEAEACLPWTQSWTSSVHHQFSQLNSNVIYPSHRYFKWHSHLQKVPLCKFLVSFLTITYQANCIFVFSLIVQYTNYMKRENSNCMGMWCKHTKTVLHHTTKNYSHMRP